MLTDGWKDVRVEAPPDGEPVLVVNFEEVAIATYRRAPSLAKGIALPGTLGAIWTMDSGEGRRYIRWWQPLPKPPKASL